MIQNDPEADFRWVLFNAYGSGENVRQRCSLRRPLAFERNCDKTRNSFRTLAGFISGIKGESVKVLKTQPHGLERTVASSRSRARLPAFYQHRGPHVVWFVTVPRSLKISTIRPRAHPSLSPRSAPGTNAKYRFSSPPSKHRIRRTKGASRRNPAAGPFDRLRLTRRP